MRILIAVPLTILLLFSLSNAVTINIPGDFPTIQGGIDRSQDGDTVLVADGIYAGDGNKNIDFEGRGIVLISENGPENCIIDSEENGRGFIFQSGENTDAVLSGFKIINGKNASLGAGIKLSDNSNPIIENCIIENNYAWPG
jgi:hypothetical protein